MLQPKRPTMLECNRSKGDVVRYDTATLEFGVMSASGYLRTYYRPIPCSSLVGVPKVGCHSYTDNVVYFTATCKKN